MKKGSRLANEPLWPPGGNWISPTTGTPRQSQDEEGQRRRGPKKKAHPILDLVRKSLEKRKSQLGPIGPHNRFDAFRIEFAMLYLAAYSPHVVLGLLHEVWNSNKKSGITLGKVSSRTIQSVYKKVANELRSGGLVQDFPRGWLVALAKFELGPWHPRTPRWLTVVFSNAKIREPMPPMRNHGRTTQSENQAAIFDSCHAVEHIVSQHRESRMALGPEEKSKRLERELKAIRKVFPDFTLSEYEKIVAWDLGLSAVRECRDQAMLAQATSSRSSAGGIKRKDEKRMTTLKGVTQSSAGSAKRATDEASDSTSKEELPRATTPEDGLFVERAHEVDDLPAPRCKQTWDLREVNGTLKPVLVSGDHSGIAASPDTGTTHDLSIPEAMDEDQSPGEPTKGLVHRFQVLELPRKAFGDHFILLNKFGKNFTDDLTRIYEDIGIDHYENAVVFPDLKASDPEEALELWKKFNCKNYPEISEFSWIPEYDPKLIELANRGYTASLLYGEQIPARFQSLLFCWLVERIISWVLGLEVHHRIKKSDDDYIPEVADFNGPDARHWAELGNLDSVEPMTPLLIECFRQPDSGEPNGERFWVPGWGSLKTRNISSIVDKFCVMQKNAISPDIVAHAQHRWHEKTKRLLRKTRIGNRDVMAIRGEIADAYFHMPLCANYQALASVEEEWVNLSMIQDFWTPQPGEEGAAAALSECITRLHMPSIRMIEQALEKRARNA